MTGRSVAADWALVGKLPGDKGDYSILRSGRAHRAEGVADDQGDLAELVWAAVPGTPQLGSMPGPGQLPWVTFVPHPDGGGQHRMAVTVIDATADRDAVGRPNVAIRYVSVPFAEVVLERTSYQALHAAVSAAHLTGTPPLRLALAGPDNGITAALADDNVFDRAASLAALVLGGEVVIALSDKASLPLPDRLAEFDRVMALLPAGMRAGTALASWQDGTQAGPFRLAYGPFAARGQAVAAYGEQIPQPAEGPAREYLRALRARSKEFGVARLIGHLGRHREPLAPDDAEEACQILCSLGQPGLVVEAVLDGQASIGRVVDARRYGGDWLDQGALDVLETYLLVQDNSAAENEISAGWSDRTAPLAASAVLGEVAAAGTSPNARRLYALTAERGDADSFLATIAEGQASDGAAVPARTVADLIAGLITPACGELPGVRRAVLRQPQLARWLLRQSLHGGADAHAWPDAQAWLDWLEPTEETAPSWLRPYAALRQPDAPFPWPGDTPAGVEAEDVALIARLACRQAPLPRVAGEWWPALLRLTQDRPETPADEPARADLIALLEEIDDDFQDPVPAVRLDTLRLYAKLPPRYFPFTGTSSAGRRYLDALWELWSEPPVEEDVAVLAARLLEALLPAAAALEQDPVSPFGEPVITLLLGVVRDDRIPLDDTVGDAISEVLEAAPGLLDDPRLTADWWTRVERLRPALRDPSARLRAAVRRSAADPVEVAVLWGKAAATSARREDLLAITGPWLAARTPTEISAMLRILDDVLRLSQDGKPDDGHEYLRLTISDLTGTYLAAPAVGRYAEYETGRTQREVAFLRQLRRMLSRHRPHLQLGPDGLEREPDVLDRVRVGEPQETLAVRAESGTGQGRHPGVVHQPGLQVR